MCKQIQCKLIDFFGGNRILVLSFCLLSSISFAQQSTLTLANDVAMADDAQGENWLAFGRTYSEQSFNPLTQINQSNVADLQLDWYMDLPNNRSLVSTPLVVDDVTYFVGSLKVMLMRSTDATSGSTMERSRLFQQWGIL